MTLRGRLTLTLLLTAIPLVAVRMAWDEGPCAVMLVWRTGLGPVAASRLAVWGLVGLCGARLLSVLMAAGPIVRRIRVLEADVRRSAEDRYETPVTVQGGDEIAELATAFNDAGARVREYVETVEAREQVRVRRTRGGTAFACCVISPCGSGG